MGFIDDLVQAAADEERVAAPLKARITALEADLKVAQNYEDQNFKRMKLFEAALRKYGVHTSLRCLEGIKPCDCGLDDLLTSA